MPLALLALAIGAFGIGTTEFVIMGLLPEVATDFGVSIPTAGFLISGYALGVAVGAPLLTALGSRFPRKRMLLSLMAIFIAGNVLSATASSFGVLLVGRVVSSFSHGAFFGVGSVVAAGLVPARKKAGAIALMFSGLTIATVLGVPLGTFLGQHFGWRSTFWAVSALGVVGLAGVAALVPAGEAEPRGALRHEIAVFRRPQVWLALATTALGFAGIFAAFTYIAPMMTRLAGYSSGAVSWLLVLFGVGTTFGNLVGGKLAERALMPSLYGLLAALALVLGAFTFTAHSKPLAAVTVFLLGAVGFATVAPLQTHIMNKAHDAPELASAANIAAFNLGNALGSWLGGLVIAAGLGYAAPNWAGVLPTALGLAGAVLAGRLDRRQAAALPPPVQAQAPAAALSR